METRRGQVSECAMASMKVQKSTPHLGVEIPKSDFLNDFLMPFWDALILMTLFSIFGFTI